MSIKSPTCVKPDQEFCIAFFTLLLCSGLVGMCLKPASHGLKKACALCHTTQGTHPLGWPPCWFTGHFQLWYFT